MATLTLTFDDDFIAQAQAYAARIDSDLATLFAAAVWPIIAPPRLRRPLSPRVEALAGCISLPADFDYKKALSEWRHEDYERGCKQIYTPDEAADDAQTSA